MLFGQDRYNAGPPIVRDLSSGPRIAGLLLGDTRNAGVSKGGGQGVGGVVGPGYFF